MGLSGILSWIALVLVQRIGFEWEGVEVGHPRFPQINEYRE